MCNTKCKNCDKGFIIIQQPIQILVNHDMAVDAGYPEMEGQVWISGSDDSYEPCDCCNGNWECCENCDKKKDMF